MTLDRVITLGTAADLKIQETTTSSYGYIFNMRTKIDGESGSSCLLFAESNVYILIAFPSIRERCASFINMHSRLFRHGSYSENRNTHA